MRLAHKVIPIFSTEISTDVSAEPRARRPILKPVEHSNVSPYLQQPLRTMDEVRAERERRQRELAEATQTNAKRQANAAQAGQAAPTARINRVV